MILTETDRNIISNQDILNFKLFVKSLDTYNKNNIIKHLVSSSKEIIKKFWKNHKKLYKNILIYYQV